MAQTNDTNRRLVLAERPQGAPTSNTLRLETSDIPIPKPGDMLMTGWIEAGKIVYREEIIDGLEAAPQAFIGLLSGENFGKRVIRVGNALLTERKTQ